MTTNLPQRVSLSKPSTAQSDGTVDLRNQIVQILSSTANGCLSELGYYPGMTKQLQQTLQANAQFQTKNAKLFEDNRALAKIAANQNYRLTFLNATDTVKLQQFMEMRDKVQSLSNERAELQRRNEALLKGKADLGYQNLLSEMQSLRERHETLQMRHAHLRNDYTRLYNMATVGGIIHPDGTPSEHALNQTQGPPESTKVSVNRDQQRTRANGTAVASSSSSTPTNVAMQHRRQSSNTLPQVTATPISHQTGSIQQQQQRRVSGDVSQDPLIIGWTQPGSSSHSTAQPSRHVVPVPRPPFVSSSTSKVPDIPQQPTCVIPRPLTPLAIDARSLPITPISPDYSQKTPTQKSFQKELPIHPTPTSQWPDVIDLTEDQITTLSDVSAAISNNHEALARSPTSSVEEPLTLKCSSSIISKALQQEEQASHDEPVEPVETMKSPASSVEVPLMKRSNPTVMDVGAAHDEPRKKARLDDFVDNHDGSTAVQMLDQSEEAEEDSDCGLDVTMEENGLMSVQDCVSAVFEEDDENEEEHTCNLCALRYQKGAIAEPPSPFVRPTLDILVKHCTDEHPAVWEKLRNSPAQDLD